MKTESQAVTENQDWEINWATRGMGTDTIATSLWSVSPLDLNIGVISNTPTTTTVWLSGGTIGVFYTVTNIITTVGGRTMQESFIMNITATEYI